MKIHEDPPKLVKLIVVAVEEYCPCHYAVTLRCMDRKHRIYLFIKRPDTSSNIPAISFGDFVFADPGKRGLFDLFDGKNFYLEKGPNLRYHLLLDEFPSEVIQRLYDEAP